MRPYLIALALSVATLSPAWSADCNPDPKPSLWCAWWLRRELHIPCSAFPPYQWNMARAFASIGRPARRGCVGCVAVFARGRGGHVGVVTGWAGADPIIKSGNVRGTVAIGARPAKNLLALRWI